MLGPSTPAAAADLPPYMNTIVGTSPGNAADTATRNVLTLNTIMFDLYGDAAKIFTKNILAQHPVILALFSGAGGRMILYRPGEAPLEAPSVPIVVPADEVRRAQHHGAGPGGGPVSEQSGGSGVASLDAVLSQPDPVGAGRPGPD